MGFLKRIFKRENRALQVPLFQNTFSGAFDALVNNDATSFAAIDLIASAFANLSGHFFGRSSKIALENYHLYDLLNNPNLDETKFMFFYNSVKDYFHSGNVYWYKYDDNEGNIVSLFRLNPNKVNVKRGSFNQKIYTHNGQEYTSRKILHIPSRYGYNGLIGKSIFSECHRIFHNTFELDKFVNNSFNNSVGNRLIIDITKEYPNATEEQILQLKNKFLQNYAGIINAGKPLIKSGKLEYSKIETDFKDNRANQLLENREFQEKEIAKLFGVPLDLLKGTGATGASNNIESLYILFLEGAIRPIATQFEQSINKLIPSQDRSRFYFEYNYNALLKTDLQTRVNTYAKQFQTGILTINEIRRKENLTGTIDDAGDVNFIMANMMPLKQDVVDSFMASAKLKMAELENLNTDSPNTNGNHSNLGDDKGM